MSDGATLLAAARAAIHSRPEWLVVGGGALSAGFAAGLALGAIGERLRARAKVVRRFRAGRVAESEAVHRLRGLGFEVLDAQVEALAHVEVDGERIECPVRADYLVRRRGRYGLVEVKSGSASRSPAENETRRQLLEYWLAFGGVPLFHLDATSGSLTRVGFAYGERASGSWSWVVLAAAALACAAFVAGLVIELNAAR